MRPATWHHVTRNRIYAESQSNVPLPMPYKSSASHLDRLNESNGDIFVGSHCCDRLKDSFFLNLLASSELTCPYVMIVLSWPSLARLTTCWTLCMTARFCRTTRRIDWRNKGRPSKQAFSCRILETPGCLIKQLNGASRNGTTSLPQRQH